MAPTYKITYFNGKGFAERARLIFAIAKQEYEDYRIGASAEGFPDMMKEWNEMKEASPEKFAVSMAKLPILEVDGVQIGQSKAIERYLAKQFGMMGSGPVEEALIDMVAEHQRDLREAFGKAETAAKVEGAEPFNKWLTEVFPGEIAKVEKSLPADEAYTAGPFLFGKVSYADVAWFQFFIEFLESDAEKLGREKAFELCPRFKRAMGSFLENPEVAEWRAKRPKGIF